MRLTQVPARAMLIAACVVAILIGMGASLPLLDAALAQEAPAAAAKEKKVKRPELVAEFFEKGAIPRLRIEIAPAEMDALRRQPRAYVRATIKEVIAGQEETVYTEVGIHLKGNAGSFRNLDDRPGITLNFNKFKKGQRFHGQDKFHLNNAVQDPTLLNEGLAGSIMRDAGVPAARCTHARVWFNGRDMGIYVLKEAFESAMFKGFFEDRSGTIFEGPFVSDIDKTPIQKNNDDQKEAIKKFPQLLQAARQGDLSKRREGIAEVLDVERFMTLMATEALICHWDGYAFNRNNYRIYHDPQSDKLVFLPHGMDQVFGNLGMPLQGGAGIVIRAMLEHPEDRAAYYDRVAELRQSVIDPERLARRVDEMSARLLPVLEEMNTSVAQNHRNQAKGLKERIANRAREIDRQLASIPKPLRFAADGTAALATWQPRVDGPMSGDRFDEAGKPRLRLKCGNPGQGSFRTTVLLARGKYVFEGRARAIGVKAQSGPHQGVGLRMSGGQFATGLVGDTDWQQLQFEFEVTEQTREVMLVCELRAQGGEAQFDLSSLRLRKR